MDPVLKAQLQQTVTVKFPSGAVPDAYGQTPVGTATTFLCRVEYDSRSEERFSVGSEERTNVCVIFPETAVGLSLECQYWLPNVSSSTAEMMRRPKKLIQLVDERGVLSHWEVYF